MLAEFLEKLQSMAESGMRPVVVESGRATKIYQAGMEGDGELFMAPMPAWRASASSFPSFVAMLNAFAGGRGRAEMYEDDADKPFVFVSSDEVTAVFDWRGWQDSSARLALQFSDEFRQLLALPSQKTARQLLRWLKVDVREAADAVLASPLATMLKDVAWSDIDRQKQAAQGFGRSIESEMQTIDELPESITLTPQLYSDTLEFSFPVDVRVHLIPEPEQKQITVQPFSQDILRAIRLGKNSLAEHVAAERDCEVFIGSPVIEEECVKIR